MRQHRVKRANRKPSFFWQGVLILAPMLVLAKLGALALSQDRRTAEQNAARGAQEFAEQAAEEVWNALHSTVSRQPLVVSKPNDTVAISNAISAYIKAFTAPSDTLRMELNPSGELVWPVPYEATPAPRPLDWSELNAPQRAAWQTAQSVSDYRAFLALSPPDGFSIAAGLALGEGLLQAGSSNELTEALSSFHTTADRYWNATTESGVPVRALAEFKKFQAQNALWKFSPIRETEAMDIYHNTLRVLIDYPSCISSELLLQLAALNINPPLSPAQAKIREMWAKDARHDWEERELIRKIYSAAQKELFRPPAVTFSSVLSGSPLNLARRAESSATFWISLRSVEEFGTLPTRTVPASSLAAEQREPELPPLTPAWSNVMLEEARDRSRRQISNPLNRGFVRLTHDERWLLVRLTNASGSTVVCRTTRAVSDNVKSALQRIRKPEYLDASVRVAGMDVIASTQLDIVRQVSGGKGDRKSVV